MKRPWSTHALVKYTLLQLPVIVLLTIVLFAMRQWLNIPLWLIWCIIGFWTIKDIIMFPVVWRSYDQSRPEDPTSIIGMRGIAKDRLAPTGYVQVRGELWRGEIMQGAPPIEQSTYVRVVEIQGLTIFVQPEDGERIKNISKK
jgi:membrane protein implicated in regulation of membrane protease activity